MKKFDLVIIGAGIMGTFHAYHAAKKGLKVCLIEKDPKPVGSTVQNFGQVVPSGLDQHWLEFGRRSLEIYKEIQQQADISLLTNGSVYVASDDDELTLLHEMQDIHQSRKYECILLSAKGVAQRFPDLSPDYAKGGLFYPQECSVDPQLMIYKLIAFIKSAYNVEFYNESAVIKIDETPDEVNVILASGAIIKGEKALVCSGYVFNLLYSDIFKSSGLITSKLQMMRTKPLKKINLKSNILTGLTIRRYESFAECPSYATLINPAEIMAFQAYGIHILFKQAADGSIIIGDSHEYAAIDSNEEFSLGTNEYITDLILKEAKRILPLPENCIASQWAGQYAQHPSGIFEHAISDKIQIRTGIGGKGMTSTAGYSERKINEWF